MLKSEALQSSKTPTRKIQIGTAMPIRARLQHIAPTKND